MSEFVKVLPSNEIPADSGRVVEVKGKQIALFNVNGQFCAIQNNCPHRGGPLGEGDLNGTVVTCPWHGWEFDVTTGVSPVNPAASVKKFNCKIEGASVLVDLD
ncbi:MAG: Rieske 2Fe-2S domain-containing protein [Deltaproteobacteria bacterium]|nr:Rieske 2Fe-2S domain-containing protein [Deltaproteobacteria bacterium]